MVDLQNITEAAEASLQELQTRSNPESDGWIASETAPARNDGGLFLVEVRIKGDEAEVFVDADGEGADGKLRRVTVEDCVLLTKAIEARFDRDEEDFSLTVSSAGIGQPLKVLRQYLKLIGKSVEVVLVGGTKFIATLENAGEESITLSYPEKQRIEGKKKPEIVTVTKTFALNDVKTTKEHIDFK